MLKLAKKAAKRKQIKRGVKEVIKAIRKANKGVVILAGDISPIDVITPLPVLCEDADIPYIYVPSKEELGAAGYDIGSEFDGGKALGSLDWSLV